MTHAARLWRPVGCRLGEGPLWHIAEQRLYWTDIEGRRLWRAGLSDSAPECLLAGETVGGFVFLANGGLRVYMDQGRVADLVQGNLTAVTTLTDETSRFNDLIATPGGGVIAGTMAQSDRRGTLYHLRSDGTTLTLLTDLGCTNGLGFSPNRTRLYYIETLSRTIFTASYTVETDAIGAFEPWRETADLPGYPDGMTVDGEGALWVAFWEGSQLVQFAPDGAITAQIAVPTPRVTSAAFGGPDLRTLFITTAGGPDSPGAGDLYLVDLPVGGIPEAILPV